MGESINIAGSTSINHVSPIVKGQTHFLSSRIALLATKHAKETVIAPLFAQALGMTVTVPEGFDSDRFGTFTRDIERQGNQLEAARAKANAVLDQVGGTVAIASEGAFFSDPMLPMLAQNRELVVLIDRDQNLEIVGQSLSSDTNFSHKTVTSVEEALTFAAAAKFPSHGLVVMPEADCLDTATIVKGLVHETELIKAVEKTLQGFPSAHIETDMRAMHNPLRMEVIADATRDLITTLQRRCPSCGTPGFSMVERKPGLPCGLCQIPTQLILKDIYQCLRCQHTEDHYYPNGIRSADPGQCWNCNP